MLSALTTGAAAAPAPAPVPAVPPPSHTLLRKTTSSRTLLRKFCHANSSNATGSTSPALSSSLHTTEQSDFRETHRLVVDQLKGHVFINQYLIIKDLGRGAQGTVKLCLDTQKDCLYAMKVTCKNRIRLKVTRPAANPEPQQVAAMGAQSFAARARRASFGGQLQRTGSRRGVDPGVVEQLSEEIAIMKKLDHPNVVKLYEVVDDPENSKMLMIMEYVAGGSVVTGTDAEHVDPIPERDALQYFRDVVKGLEYLHFQQVAHLDIKPDNLLLAADGQVKITDFGCATTCSADEVIQGTLGTPSFLSPEACSGEPYDGFASDVWALGACLYMFVFGHAPFIGETTLRLYDAIRNAPLQFPAEPLVSAPLQDLITRMLAKDVASRITLEGIKQHEWVTQGMESSEQQTMERIEVTGVEKRAAVTNSDSTARPDALQATTVQFEDGEYLLRQGEVSSVLYYIEEGACEVFHVPHHLQAEKVVPDCDFADLLDDEEDDPDDALAFHTVSGNAAFWNNLLTCPEVQAASLLRPRRESDHSTQGSMYSDLLVTASAPSNIMAVEPRMHSALPLQSAHSGYMAVAAGLAAAPLTGGATATSASDTASQAGSVPEGSMESVTLVKRASSSLSVNMMRKGVLRSASMHLRMQKLVSTARNRAVARRASSEMPVEELVALRGPGSIVGTLRLPGRQQQPQRSTTTVVAKGTVRALAFSQEQMEVLRTSPLLRASMVQAEAEAMVQDAVERFAEFEEEIKELEELRATVNDLSSQLRSHNSAAGIMTTNSTSMTHSSLAGQDLVVLMDDRL